MNLVASGSGRGVGFVEVTTITGHGSTLPGRVSRAPGIGPAAMAVDVATGVGGGAGIDRGSRLGGGPTVAAGQGVAPAVTAVDRLGPAAKPAEVCLGNLEPHLYDVVPHGIGRVAAVTGGAKHVVRGARMFGMSAGSATRGVTDGRGHQSAGQGMTAAAAHGGKTDSMTVAGNTVTPVVVGRGDCSLDGAVLVINCVVMTDFANIGGAVEVGSLIVSQDSHDRHGAGGDPVERNGSPPGGGGDVHGNPLDVNVGSHKFTIPAGNFKNTKGKFTCSKVTLSGGEIAAATFDFNKNTFTLTIKNTNFIAAAGETVLGIGFDSFSGSDKVTLP